MSESDKKAPLAGRILYHFFGVIGKLPSWWHYLWADLLSYPLQYIVGYRKEVIRKNLRNSFPEKSHKELKSLEHKVYVNLCDLAVEIIMLCGFTERRLRRHVVLENGEIFGQLHNEGHNSIYMFLGHYGDWEWFTALQKFLPDTELNVLYHKQHGVWNYLMQRARSKFGAELLEKYAAPRVILSRRHDDVPRTYVFVADQSPGINNTHVFIDFFGQKTAVYTGMERLAQIAGSPVVYVEIKKPKRGQYRVRIELMTMDASEYGEGKLAQDFMKRLEETIRRAPEYWLWSHRRWRYSIEDVQNHFPERKISILES